MQISAYNEFDPASDLGVYEYVALTRFLGEQFPAPVDVVNRATLKPHLRPSAERDALYAFERAEAALLSIQVYGREAQSFLGGMSRESFREDRRTFHAVTRCLEIVSEATRRLSEPLRARHPHLPWRDIADAGNVYQHDYDNVAADFVFKTTTVDLPLLLAAVERELRQSPPQAGAEISRLPAIPGVHAGPTLLPGLVWLADPRQLVVKLDPSRALTRREQRSTGPLRRTGRAVNRIARCCG